MELMPFINVENLTYYYDKRPVLNKVNLCVHKGQVISLLGPNGSGKTTLLKMMLGFFKPAEGRVLLEGRSVTDISPREMASRIAYVPQLHRITFGYRVKDVVLMGRIAHKPFFSRYSAKDRAFADQALEKLSLTHLKNRSYTEISGGERQLTLIARALAQGVDTFILDEPVNGLDYGNQIRLLKNIADLAEQGYTFIQTSHFPEHAIWISDRVAMLEEGRVIADGKVGDVITPANLCRLYKTPIHIVEAEDGMQVCMPGLMRKRHGESKRNGKIFNSMAAKIKRSERKVVDSNFLFEPSI